MQVGKRDKMNTEEKQTKEFTYRDYLKQNKFILEFQNSLKYSRWEGYDDGYKKGFKDGYNEFLDDKNENLIEEGRLEGIVLGIEKGQLWCLNNMIKNGYSTEDALKLIGIPETNWDMFKEKLKKTETE